MTYQCVCVCVCARDVCACVCVRVVCARACACAINIILSGMCAAKTKLHQPADHTSVRSFFSPDNFHKQGSEQSTYFKKRNPHNQSLVGHHTMQQTQRTTDSVRSSVNAPIHHHALSVCKTDKTLTSPSDGVLCLTQSSIRYFHQAADTVLW